jgi:5'-methylthioadenosine phosphorylase
MSGIGIIGGSGLYGLEGLANPREVGLETPFGTPSDKLVTGEQDGLPIAFLPRHGRGHRLTPTEVPAQANVFALKSLGIDWVVSVSAVGSLREDLHPGDLVLADQFIDRTMGRPNSFFGEGIVAHVSLADPTCPVLRQAIVEAAAACNLDVKQRATYICIEGPAFSTRAESHLYRSWGADLIGMTAMPEVRLAREASLHYATIALVTDYDCWKVDEDAVNVDAVLATFKRNVENVRRILAALPKVIAKVGAPSCQCGAALSQAILTAPDAIPKNRRAVLAPLFKKP